MYLSDEMRAQALAISREQLRELRTKYPDINPNDTRAGQAEATTKSVDAPAVFVPLNKASALV